METFLIPTSQASHLLGGVLKKTKDIKIIFPDLNREERRFFPDGEIYVALSSAALRLRKGKNKRRFIVLHAGTPKPNEGLVELELILQILRDKKIAPC